MAPDPRSVRSVFDEASEITDPRERAAFLARACAADDALRTKVEVLLAAHEEAGGFLADFPSDQRPAPARHAPDALERIGPYTLLQEIGEGGCGVVYLAEQVSPLRRQVALKIIKQGMDTRQVVARFEAERQALALMDHPHIAKVLDAGTTKTGRPYFVMEMVRGIRITDFCELNQLATTQRLELFIKVCQAIQHAHQKGIIHRDLKPSNILVTPGEPGSPGAPKVIDFGIAKAMSEPLTEKTVFTAFEQFIGTPAYMSPEQAERSGLDIDTRSDIYSLGVLLYELLTGSTPFDAKELLASGIDAMRKTIREKEPMRPSTRLATLGEAQLTTTAKRRSADTSTLMHQIKGDLDWVVMKCLEKDRNRRYETANGLAMDIQRHLSCEPVLARPRSRLYELQKTVRRHQFGFAAAAAIILVLAAGIALTTWQAVRATRAGKEETRQRLAADSASKQALAAQKFAETARADEARMRLLAEARAYAGDMSLAAQALAADNLGLATELLDRHRPKPGQPDRRGWEWRYLWQHSRSDALYTLCKRPGSITGLTVSHDGKWLAVGAGGVSLSSPFFSASRPSGEWLAVGAAGVSVWNLRSRREVMHEEGKEAVAFSPVRPLLAMWNSADSGTPESKYRLSLWDAETGRLLPAPPSPDSVASPHLRGMAFTSDGQSLVTASLQWGSDANQLTQWRVADGRKLATCPIRIRGPGVGVPVSMARSTNLIALAEEDRWLRVLDANRGREKFKTKAPGKGWLEAVALSADGKVLAASSATDETTIRLWDLASGRELGLLEGHRAYVISLAFWPDGKTLASGSADQTIRIWNVQEKRSVAVLRGHRDEVHRLALLPDNSTLVSGAKDGTVMVWDTTAIRHKNAIVTLPSTAFGFWTPASGGDSILTVGDQGWLTRWHGEDFEQSERLFQIDPNPQGVCVSADQQLLANGTKTGVIKLWDVPQRTLLRETPICAGPVSPRAFLAGNHRLAVWKEAEKSLAVHDVVTGRQISSWSNSEPAPAPENISPDGRWCITGGGNYTGILRELASGQALSSVPFNWRGRAAFSWDGSQLAVPFAAGVVRLWDVPALKERAPLRGFLMGAHSAAFSPDGRRLAVGSAGHESLKIWDLDSGLNVLTLPGEGGPCWETAFSPDGNILAARHEQGMLDIWRVPSWEEIAAAEVKENAQGQRP